MTDSSYNRRLRDPEVLRRSVLDFQQMKEWIREPLILERADGVRYWDVDGKCYLDGLSGIFVVNIGHNNRRVIQALHTQLERMAFAPPLHATHPAAIELAALVSQI